MRTVFADTSYWLALLNPRDHLHQKAKHVSASLGPAHIVTTEMILVELLNDYARRGEALRTAGLRLVEQLERDPNSTIVPQTTEQFRSALSLYAERKDKTWGITDCASFLTMQEHGTQDALTYDRHFQQMGFNALLRE